MSVYRFVLAQVPLKTRATQLPGHPLTNYCLQMCRHHFERIQPLQPRLGPFVHFFSHIEGQSRTLTVRLVTEPLDYKGIALVRLRNLPVTGRPSAGANHWGAWKLVLLA